MTDEEFERLYGRPPVRKATRKRVKVYWGRVIIALIVLVLFITGIVQLINSIFGGAKKKNVKTASVNSSADTSAAEQVEDDSDTDEELQANVTREFKVCIDPGHGGEDDGACLYDDNDNVTRREKNDTLMISLALRDYLVEQGVQVVMTRETDKMLGSDVEEDLTERCFFANDNYSDLFVSIHRDSVTDDVSGFEAWAHSKQPEMDTTLATNVMTALSDVGISENRGVNYGYTDNHEANYHVNADTVCPSILLEMGFISSESDNKLIDEQYQEYAKAIGDALIKTAIDLGVIDSQGKRIMNEQLISRSKLYYSLDFYYTDTNPDHV